MGEWKEEIGSLRQQGGSRPAGDEWHASRPLFVKEKLFFFLKLKIYLVSGTTISAQTEFLPGNTVIQIFNAPCKSYLH